MNAIASSSWTFVAFNYLEEGCLRTNEKSLISPVSRPSSTPCNADKLTSTLQHLSFPFNPVTSIIISHRIPAGGQVYVSKKAPVCCFLFRLLNKFPWSIAKFIQNYVRLIRDVPGDQIGCFFEHCSSGLWPPPPSFWTFMLRIFLKVYWKGA